MKRLHGYPNGFFIMLISTMVLVSITGLLMLPWVAEFKLEWDTDINLELAYRLPAVVLHVLCGWTLLMLLGALWHGHMRAGWRKKQNHASGLIQSGCLLLLALTGIGLYYFGSQRSQLLASMIHTILGLFFSLTFVWHYCRGAHNRKRQPFRLNRASHKVARRALTSSVHTSE